MGRHVAVVLGVLLVTGVLTSALAVQPAFACSCAEATEADLVARNPQVAIGVIRRIDRDGGTTGVGAVEHTLRGELPAQVPLHLDDGGSCRPYVGIGQLATLAFEPAGGSWRTIDCGMLDAGATFAEAYGELQVDPDARGDPALAVATMMPGTEVVLLDRALRVLATAAVPDVAAVEACGEALLATTSWEARGSAVLLSLPDLEPVAERQLRRMERVVDTRCDDRRVTAITVREGDQRTFWLYPNLLRGRPRELPAADDAKIAGDEVLLLRGDNDGRRGVLSAQSLDTRTTVHRRTFDGLAAYGMVASPDGEHIVLRGYAEEPVLLTLHARSGAIVGRTGGDWMPPEDDAWLADDRLLLVNEQRAMGDPPLGGRVVDLRFAEVGRLPALTPSRLVADSGVVAAVDGAELSIAAVDGLLRTSADPRTAAAFDVAVLGKVARPDDPAAVPALPEPAVPEPAPRPWPVIVAVAVAAAAAAAVVVRRRRASHR